MLGRPQHIGSTPRTDHPEQQALQAERFERTQLAERADELAEAVADQLLARYGVVFRDLLVRETFSFPWRDILWALRRLEARGQVRGGRFITGFVGEQYALPEAVSALRAVRARERNGTIVRVSACDPLNLIGIVVPGERIQAARNRSITYRDGVPITLPRTSEARSWILTR